MPPSPPCPPLSQGHIVEVEHRVNMSYTTTVANRELVVRYNTSLQSGAAFYTDLNSFQMARRDRSPSLSLQPPPISSASSLPIQANYYPITSLAFLQQPPPQQGQEQRQRGLRFSVHTVQAHGVASIKVSDLRVSRPWRAEYVRISSPWF